MTEDRLALSRRQILASAGAIGLASAGAGLGTSAFFSDQETFENNTLVAGTLDMGVAYSAHYSDWSDDEDDGLAGDIRMPAGQVGTADDLEPGEVGLPANDAWLIAVESETDAEQFLSNTQYDAYNDGDLEPCPLGEGDQADGIDRPVIDLDDVKPGDFGEVTFDFILCDNPGFVWLDGTLRDASENGLTEPEADDPDEEEGVVELLDVVQAAVWIDDGNNYQNDTESPLAVGSIRDVLGMLNGGSLGTALNGDIPAEEGGGAAGARNCFSGETEHSVVFAWWVPVDHGNEIQSDSATFDLGLYTEQCRHNDGSGMAPEGQQTFTIRVENLGGTVNGSPNVLSPGAFAVHDSSGPIFEVGEPASAGLEDVAEDGIPGGLANELAAKTDLTDSGAFGASPIGPGGAYEFEVTAVSGDALSFATMFVQSNDLFFAPGPDGIDLFDADSNPIDGDVTDQVDLWDASTEDNQEPGTGSNQAPRQGSPDTGPADSNSSTVQLVSNVNPEGYSYPTDEAVIEVTVTPQ